MKYARLSCVLLALGTMAGTASATPGTFRTVAEDITLPAVQDGGTFETVSGDVRIGSGVGALTVRTVSGDVDVQTIDGPADLRTVSGNLTLGGARGAVVVHTSSGDLTIAGLAGDLDAATASGDVTARLNWSGPTPHTVLAVSASGDIVLHLPHDFSGVVDLQTFQSAAHANDIPMRQNLGLPVTLGPWLPQPHGGERRRVIVRGVVGSGEGTGNRITVRGGASEVTILRD